jgi:hypothetical protein
MGGRPLRNCGDVRRTNKDRLHVTAFPFRCVCAATFMITRFLQLVYTGVICRIPLAFADVLRRNSGLLALLRWSLLDPAALIVVLYVKLTDPAVLRALLEPDAVLFFHNNTAVFRGGPFARYMDAAVLRHLLLGEVGSASGGKRYTDKLG